MFKHLLLKRGLISFSSYVCMVKDRVLYSVDSDYLDDDPLLIQLPLLWRNVILSNMSGLLVNSLPQNLVALRRITT